MPLFPDSPSTPSISKIAVYFFGGGFALATGGSGFQKFFPDPASNPPIPPDPKAGTGYIIAALFLLFLTYQAGKWVDNSEY